MEQPIIFRLIEYREIWVRILARIPGIPNAVCKIPVTKPAAIPARKAKIKASHGFIPPRINMTATAPPVASEPSTDRSAKSSNL